MKKRTLSFLLAVLMLSAVSCGEKAQTDTSNDTEKVADTTAAATEVQYLDNLPADLNYNGETVRFLYREEVADEFYVEKEDGDIVHDAIFQSMRSVEERLNVNIEVELRPGHLVGARDTYMNHVTNSVLAGDKTYDWVDLMIGNSPLRAQEGIFLNLLENPMVDLSQPWYIPDLADTVSILDQLYFVSGDASLGYLKCAFSMYYNQDLGKTYGIEDLYAVVEDGKWTIDKLMEVAKITASDLNNDGKFNMDDQLGYVSHDSNHPKGFMYSMNAPVFSKQSDGNWTFDYGSEHDYNVAEKCYELKMNTDGVYFFSSTNAVAESLDEYNRISSKFCNDEIFIISAEMDDVVSQFRSMKSNYGILPYPKYDEAQESYFTASRNTHNAFSMPTTCANPEMAGAVLEALSASNYEKVLPTYFEVALKTKYAADNQSAKIFDIIHDSMVLDFGYVYGNALSSVTDAMVGAIFGNTKSLASQIKANEKKAIKAYENYVKKIETIISQ